jgi:hypothetical protein
MVDISELHPIFRKQIECLQKNDKEGVLALYHPEAETLSFYGPNYGRDAIRKVLDGYDVLDVEFVEVNEYVHSDDMIMTRTTLRVKGQDVVAFGGYVIKDDMIWRSFGCDEGGTRDWWTD